MVSRPPRRKKATGRKRTAKKTVSAGGKAEATGSNYETLVTYAHLALLGGVADPPFDLPRRYAGLFNWLWWFGPSWWWELGQYVYQRPKLSPKQLAALRRPALFMDWGSTKSDKAVSCMEWLVEQAMLKGKRGREFWWVAPVAFHR